MSKNISAETDTSKGGMVVIAVVLIVAVVSCILCAAGAAWLFGGVR